MTNDKGEVGQSSATQETTGNHIDGRQREARPALARNKTFSIWKSTPWHSQLELVSWSQLLAILHRVDVKLHDPEVDNERQKQLRRIFRVKVLLHLSLSTNHSYSTTRKLFEAAPFLLLFAAVSCCVFKGVKGDAGDSFIASETSSAGCMSKNLGLLHRSSRPFPFISYCSIRFLFTDHTHHCYSDSDPNSACYTGSA